MATKTIFTVTLDEETGIHYVTYDRCNPIPLQDVTISRQLPSRADIVCGNTAEQWAITGSPADGRWDAEINHDQEVARFAELYQECVNRNLIHKS